MIHRQNLHSGWKMRPVGEAQYMAARVPGSVYRDLLDNKKMEDPYWRDNEEQALKIMDHDFEYVTVFSPDAELLKADKVLLRCEGLDTIAEIYLNDQLLGLAKNMHRIWEFDVKALLKQENTLKILFHSPTQYIKQMNEIHKIDGSSDAMRGFPHIRKAHCMFGWDWGPRLPDAGIWRDIMLCGITTARIDSVYITQEHAPQKVTLLVDVAVERLTAGTELNYHVEVTAPDGQVSTYCNSPKEIVVEQPQLWWPNGYGKQPLYKVQVKLFHKENELDRWEKKIGLRTMTMHIEKDEWGESFAHEVNGVQIFAMGADYIPEDNILSWVTPNRTRSLLQQCVEANFNAVRVWGGGYYPNDDFYDSCDELGLVVWQDFMFACAVYDLTDAFEENIRAEFADNIKRIRNHACLGLWCGNNEMEMFVQQGNWVSRPKEKADYIKMYEYIIPQMLKQLDPNTFYWPASPSSGGSFDEPNSPSRGDVHYWDVWHGSKPFSEYRKFFFRYASEFGFQSFPCLKTVESFTLPEDRNVFSYVMEKHQRNNAANGKIMTYMAQTFLYPSDFATLLYASQLLQAEAIKYGVEHWRRNRGRCMGAIYWQLNDCWPVASWASIDYYGRWKALHYYAKRFFAPVMLSCCEESILTQDTNVNAEPYNVEKSIQLNVANETMQPQSVMVKWALRNNKAEVLQQGEKAVTVHALSSLWLDKIEFPDADLHSDYVSYAMYGQNGLISSGTVLFCTPKHFAFVDPQLSFRVEGDEIVVTAKAYARSVELLNEQQDWILSDNYFDMNAGETRVKIQKGQADNVTVRSVYDIR